MWRMLAGSVAVVFVVNAQAEENVPLKAGVGRETVEAYCGACHSFDYPRQNAFFLNRQGWETEVNKMIKTYGAPIERTQWYLGARSQPRALLRKHSAPTKIHERNALTVSSSLPVSRLMRFRASRKRGPNPGATADDRGLYLYNPVTVPLAPAGEMPSIR
jgi:hypothetical protein